MENNDKRKRQPALIISNKNTESSCSRFSMPNSSSSLFHDISSISSCDQKSSLGLIDDDDDFNTSTTSTNSFDEYLLQNITTNPALLPPPPPPEIYYSHELLLNTTTPATPNSSSLSSSSNDDHDHDNKRKEEEEEEEDQENTTKEQVLKVVAKKTNKKQKREREARYAFMTKTETDHLDDGYRWRKYGQKAVKNSPFPRSYYRCTSTACGVKKRVERSCEDTSILITTYEGTHTHPCPITPRATFGLLPETTTHDILAGVGAAPNHFFTIPQMLHYHQHQQQQQHAAIHQQQQQQQAYFHNLTPPLITLINTSTTNPTLLPPERPFCPPASSLPIRDHGLLQDMLPSQIFKEDQ